MLTLTLRGLERDGLVKRTQFPTIPPRVDYELTELGRSLWEAVKRLGEWAQDHVQHITRARAAFDKKTVGWIDAVPPSRRPFARPPQDEEFS
jgi:DNA-binding HxlR family transcriptional regulator